jgi:hypothetical protein
LIFRQTCTQPYRQNKTDGKSHKQIPNDQTYRLTVEELIQIARETDRYTNKQISYIIFVLELKTFYKTDVNIIKHFKELIRARTY